MHAKYWYAPQAHSQCVTEHEKYAKAATKPGGWAANGVYEKDGQEKRQPGSSPATGREFLSSRAPWTCSVCSVKCTSEATLLSHASGAKHQRRSRAALAAAQPLEAPPVAAQNGSAKREAEQHVEKASGKKRKIDEGALGEVAVLRDPDASGQMEPNATGQKEQAPKWRKLAFIVLQKRGKADGGLKVKKLQKLCLAAAGVDEQDAQQACDHMLTRWQTCKKLRIEGGMVSVA